MRDLPSLQSCVCWCLRFWDENVCMCENTHTLWALTYMKPPDGKKHVRKEIITTLGLSQKAKKQ